MRKKRVLIFILITALLLLTGCKSGKTSDDYMTIVDDLALIALQQDQDSAAYDKVLDAIGDYIENSGPEKLVQTLALTGASIKQMEADSGESVPYEMNEDFSELLVKYGIDPEEYRINANIRSAYLAGYLESLKLLEFYLENEQFGELQITRDGLTSTYLRAEEEQRCERAFNYYGINYWFAEWDKKGTAYAQEKIVDHLESFVTEECVWETSRPAVERKLDLYLDQIAAIADEITEFHGESQERLYEEQQSYEERASLPEDTQ